MWSIENIFENNIILFYILVCSVVVTNVTPNSEEFIIKSDIIIMINFDRKYTKDHEGTILNKIISFSQKKIKIS